MVDYERVVYERLIADTDVDALLDGRVWASELPDESDWSPGPAAVVRMDTIEADSFTIDEPRGEICDVLGTMMVVVVTSAGSQASPRAECHQAGRAVLAALTGRFPAEVADPDDADVILARDFQVRALSMTGPRLDDDNRLWTAVVRADFYASEDE